MVELLVSMTITIIIIGLLVFVTRSSFDSLSQGQGNVSNYHKGKLALDQMYRDLESMVYREGNDYEWLVASTASGDAITGGFTAFASNLAFFTVAQDRYDGDVTGNNGDVSCVHYGIRFVDPVGGGNGKMILYRNITNPDDTFTNLLGEVPQADLLQTLGNGVTPDSASIVADNIRELTINFTVEDSNGVIQRIPVISATGATGAADFTLAGTGITLPVSANGGRIISIEINAQVLSEESASLLNVANPPIEKIEKGITRFSKTIHIAQLN